MSLLATVRRIPVGPITVAYFGLTAITLVYHGLIVVGALDYRMVWGGRLRSRGEMARFEAGSMLALGGLAAAAWVKRKARSGTFAFRVTRLVMFAASGLFLLNTLGNLSARERVERLVFTPLTLLASGAALRIGLEPPATPQT